MGLAAPALARATPFIDPPVPIDDPRYPASRAALESIAPGRDLTAGVLAARERLPTAGRSAAEALAAEALVARFPVPENAGQGQRVVYSNSRQRVWLVEADESLVDTYLVSGRRGVPRPGNYRVFSKSEKAWAGHGGITMNYMVRFTRGRSGIPIGFHDLPRYGNGTPMQTAAELGQFRSAGCVRQHPDKAIFLYDWADIGTPVVVVP